MTPSTVLSSMLHTNWPEMKRPMVSINFITRPHSMSGCTFYRMTCCPWSMNALVAIDSHVVLLWCPAYSRCSSSPFFSQLNLGYTMVHKQRECCSIQRLVNMILVYVTQAGATEPSFLLDCLHTSATRFHWWQSSKTAPLIDTQNQQTLTVCIEWLHALLRCAALASCEPITHCKKQRRLSQFPLRMQFSLSVRMLHFPLSS
jgi:hypothetical protein